MGEVELRAISKIFPRGVEALTRIDLAIADGECLAIVGPSGSGKSTLLRLVAGLVAPTSGSVWLDGRPADGLAPRDRDVAMVFQDPAPYPHLSVYENLAFGLRARRRPATEVQTRVEETASLLGLSDCLGRRPAALSGGQRQRVALGRALARRPRLLLLDEPLSNLDAPLRAAIRADLIDLLRRLGITTLLVTHDQAEALALGDRVAVLDRGRIAQVGTPADVYDRPASRFVATFIGSPPMSLLPVVVEPDGEAIRIRLLGVEPEATATIPAVAAWAGPLRRHGPGTAEIGLRAEHVREVPSGTAGLPPDGLTLVATVRRLEPAGHETIATLALGPRELSLRLPPTRLTRVGETLRVTLDLARALVFDAGGRRLDGLVGSGPPAPYNPEGS